MVKTDPVSTIRAAEWIRILNRIRTRKIPGSCLCPGSGKLQHAWLHAISAAFRLSPSRTGAGRLSFMPHDCPDEPAGDPGRQDRPRLMMLPTDVLEISPQGAALIPGDILPVCNYDRTSDQIRTGQRNAVQINSDRSHLEGKNVVHLADIRLFHPGFGPILIGFMILMIRVIHSLKEVGKTGHTANVLRRRTSLT